MGDFRPISCVNLIDKLMIKLLADRLGKVSSEPISPNQTTLIEGRLIFDNTTLDDEMVCGFGSIDLRKAFDTIKLVSILVICYIKYMFFLTCYMFSIFRTIFFAKL